jgi:hypothetical protein
MPYELDRMMTTPNTMEEWTQEFIAQGMSEDEAQVAAVIESGESPGDEVVIDDEE